MRRILLTIVAALVVPGLVAAESPADADAKARAITTAIDNALDADWAARSITPAVVATDAEFARRLYLDLIGRIPNVSEVRTFEDDKTAVQNSLEEEAKKLDNGLFNFSALGWPHYFSGAFTAY